MAASLVVHGATAILLGLVLLAAGQPLFSEDVWWHLAIGELYARAGPWLEADPFLFSAEGPPAPAAWLFDLALHGVERAVGLQGLRAAHVAAVTGILALAWSLLRRASGSAVLASLGSGIFACLSAYRLFQLRPHLFTIFAALLLVRLLVVDGSPPSRRRVAACALLLALWANAHGAFLLGPVLLGAAFGGVAAASVLGLAYADDQGTRLRRLLIALVAGSLATLLNPGGATQHLLYFAAGAETPELAVVIDEWAPVGLLQLPVANLPPSLLSWGLVWCLVIVTPCVVAQLWRGWRAGSPSDRRIDIDPALLAISVVALLGMLSAVRLLWMGIFPLALAGQGLRASGWLEGRKGARATWAAAVAALLLVPAFRGMGDWPMISQGIHRAWYAQPYAVYKYEVNAVWMLREAQLEGRLYNDYFLGNFLSYWLAPRMRVFVNGSLNVPGEVMKAGHAIARRRGATEGESFGELLDRFGVDVFLGVGLPVPIAPGRPELTTTAHLEGEPGWTLVFRNVQSAVYLRDSPGNRANLQRVADHYAASGVPFDTARGFDPERVIAEAPRWAVEHRLIGPDHAALLRASRSLDPAARSRALGRLAVQYAAVGLYGRAAALDRQLLRVDPDDLPARRRLTWCLLRQGELRQGLAAAEQLAALAPPEDGLSRLIVDIARRSADAGESEAASLISLLPVFTRHEIKRVLGHYRQPVARSRRG